MQKNGKEKSKGLLGLHALTGADWGGKFFWNHKTKMDLRVSKA